MGPTQASSSTSSSDISPEESRQAGPLPTKRGEIGFRESAREEVDVKDQAEESRDSSPVSLPERHPADRSPAPTAAAPVPVTAPVAPAAPPTTSSDDASSTSSLKKRKGLFSFLKRKKYGLQSGTLLGFTLQLFIMLGFIAAWIVAGLSLAKKNDNSSMSAASSAIFVHVIFAVGFLAQCLFLERRLYVLRAQRYAFVHPGEILPSSRRRGQAVNASVAFSPWNRPPLPTYAAALAESGVGTGDVEDHLIAAPPPPAYGNTRGSTFLLSGFLSPNLRAQRPVSVRTETDDRPLSYASNDDDWQIIQDADRARQLEETLSSLQGPGRRQSSP